MSISNLALKAAASMPSEKLGAWFEAETQAIFKQFKETQPFTFLRLYDSKSAGNYLPKQPGDFICCSANDVFLVECKASARHRSLKSCLSQNVSKEQAVEHWMWDRSTHKSVFLFVSVTEGTTEIWDGKYVADHRRKGVRMCADEGILINGSAQSYKLQLELLFFDAARRRK